MGPLERYKIEQLQEAVHERGNLGSDCAQVKRILEAYKQHQNIFELYRDIDAQLWLFRQGNSSKVPPPASTLTGWQLDAKWRYMQAEAETSLPQQTIGSKLWLLWTETWSILVSKLTRRPESTGAISVDYLRSRTARIGEQFGLFDGDEAYHNPEVDIHEITRRRRPKWVDWQEDMEAEDLIQILAEATPYSPQSTQNLYKTSYYTTPQVSEDFSNWSIFKHKPTASSGWFATGSARAMWRSVGGFDAKRIDRLFDQLEEYVAQDFVKRHGPQIREQWQYPDSNVFSNRFQERVKFCSDRYEKCYQQYKPESHEDNFFEWIRNAILSLFGYSGVSDVNDDDRAQKPKAQAREEGSGERGTPSFFRQVLESLLTPTLYLLDLVSNDRIKGFFMNFERGRSGIFSWVFDVLLTPGLSTFLDSLNYIFGRKPLLRWMIESDAFGGVNFLMQQCVIQPQLITFCSVLEGRKIENSVGEDVLTFILKNLDTSWADVSITFGTVTFTLPSMGDPIQFSLFSIVYPKILLPMYYIQAFFAQINNLWNFCIASLMQYGADSLEQLIDAYMWVCELPGRMANVGSGWYIVAAFFLMFHLLKAHLTEKYGDVVESFFRQCFGKQPFTLTEATLFVNFILLLWAFKVLLNNWAMMGMNGFTGAVSPVTTNEGVVVWDFFDSYFFTDGLSTLFVFLTIAIVPLCVLVSSGIRFKLELLLKCLIAVEVLLIIAFSTSNFFVFYLAFEAVLIPMYFIIGLWGSRSERTRASYLFFIYTLAGSIFFLLALVLINTYIGSFNFWTMLESMPSVPWNIRVLLWICLFCGFAFKVPLYPVHSWLTVAHVEAPTCGSIILASLLLKLGGYGLCRFVVALLPDVTLVFQSSVLTVCLVGFVYATVAAYRQLDLKRFVAYTSIAHMHFIILSLFTLTDVGYWGSVHSMISHGFISSGLFLMVGSLYDRFGVRNTAYYSGLADQMPLFAVFWTVFLFANAGIPFFSGFPGEFCGFIATFTMNPVFGFLLSIGFICGVIYSVLNISRVIHGSATIWLTRRSAVDLLDYEFGALIFLATWVFILGIWPDLIVNLLRSTCLF